MISDQIDDDSDGLNLAALLDGLLQYLWLIVSIFVASVLIGIGYAILAAPIYRADVLIQVEDNKSSMLSGVQDIANALGASSSPVSGEIEILLSREVVMKAIVEARADLRVSPKRFPLLGQWYARQSGKKWDSPPPLGLSSYAWGGEVLALDFLDVGDTNFGQNFIFRATESGVDIESEAGELLAQATVRQVFEFDLNGSKVRGAISSLNARPGVEFSVSKVAPVRAYKEIIVDLKAVEATRQSGIIKLSFENSSVAFAQKLINAVAKAYLVQNVERRSAEADQSLKFLSEQLPEIKRNVERSEDALTTFRTKTNTISVDKEADSLLSRAVNIEKSRLELQLKRDELRQRFRPDHPELKALEAQLTETEREASRVNDQVNRLPTSQRDLLRLQRDAEVSNELYIALLNNVQQLKVAKAGTVGNVRIVDYAIRDDVPVAPNKIIVIIVSVAAGLLLGIIAAVIARLLRPTVRDANEIERATGLVSYASIPESDSQERLDSHHRDKKGKRAIVEGRNQLLAVLNPDDPAIESLRSLRTGLTFALMGANHKNIVITGATAGLGKSFVSANLSALLAAGGKRVLLVETDMRRPQLGTYFGYRNSRGLAEILANATALEDVLRKEEIQGGTVDILPSGGIPPNPGELLLSEKFAELIDSVQNRYDYIIFDSAPILPVGDTLAVARRADAVFMVVRAEQSTVGEVKDAIKKLDAAGAEVKGVIFNGVKRRRVGYGYAYRYYYGYGDK